MNTEDMLIRDEDTVLERLKKIHDVSEAERESRADCPGLISKDFDQLVRIAKTMGRTKLKQEGKMDEADYLNSFNIVPDNQIADAHNNEINLSGFVRRFIPESDWANFIEVENN